MDAGPIKNEHTKTTGPQLGTGLTLALLSIAGFAIGANIRITDPLLPTFASEFGTTVGAAAMVAMFYAMAHGALQIVYGPLGDRVGKLPVITVAALASAVISAATAFAGSLFGLAALRLASGLATAAIVPLTLAFIGDTTTYAQRHVALARFTGVVLLGLMCGQVLGGLIAEFLGWRAVFYFIGAVFAIAGIGLVFSPAMRNHQRPPARSAKQAYSELFGLFKRPAVRHVLLAVCLQGGVSFTSAAFVGAHLHDRFDFSLGAIGVMLGLFAAGGLVYAFITARTLARFGERGVLAIGGIAFGLSFLAMAVTPVWHTFIPALFIAGVGLMMVHNMLQVGATQMAPEARGAALSLFAAMIFFGQTLGFAALSPIYDNFGGVPIFLATAVIFPLIAFGFRSTVGKHHQGD